MLEKQDIRKNRRHSTLDKLDGRTGPSRPARRRGPSRNRSHPRRKPPRARTARAWRSAAYFTKPGDDGFTNVQWELRTAAITGENGKMVFEQRDVEVPKRLEPDRDQRRGAEVLPRHGGHAGRASARCAS